MASIHEETSRPISSIQPTSPKTTGPVDISMCSHLVPMLRTRHARMFPRETMYVDDM